MEPIEELSPERLQEVVEAALGHSERGARDLAWACAQPAIQVHSRQPDAARALIHLVAGGAFDRPKARVLVGEVFEAHVDDPAIVAAVGGALETVHDTRFLNAAPPGDALFRRVAERLVEFAEVAGQPPEAEARVRRGLACVARLLGRGWDDVAEHSHLRLVELDPEAWQEHYDLGLFYKTRGRFEQWLLANQCAEALGGEDDDGVAWNTGICATGAWEGETAARVWSRLGLRADVGRFGLPEGNFGEVKVRLAARPLASRGADADEPGVEETVWIERLSPCHGVVRSAPAYDVGVEYGDVVLFDGAAITHRRDGELEIPVFPQLVTLRRCGYQVYSFSGTQRSKGQIAKLSARLPEDSVLYVHNEQLTMLCEPCWTDPEVEHAHEPAEHEVVEGKLCAPPGVAPAALLAALDDAVAGEAGVRVLVPELCAAAGVEERAFVG